MPAPARACRVERYHRGELAECFEQILDGYPALRQPTAACNRILLKPNFVVPVRLPDASVTHPDFYMSLAHVLRRRGFTVGIGESPAIGTCVRALELHGVLAECEQYGFDVVEFRAARTFAGVENERHYSELSVAGELSDWHGIVNLPKLKTHQQFTFTAATKNLYGCVTGKRKFVRHNLCGNDPRRFAKMIVANAMEVNAVAHIADGITAMHVKGPRGGKAYPLGCVLSAPDPLVLDRMFCHLISLDPDRTPLFSALSASERRRVDALAQAALGHNDLDAVTDFEHAPLIHISFSPWHVARSGLRSLRYSWRTSMS